MKQVLAILKIARFIFAAIAVVAGVFGIFRQMDAAYIVCIIMIFL